MNNLMALRKISQNRDAFFQQKNNTKKKLDPVLWSKLRGPRVTREQILQTIGYINQKTYFQENVETLSQNPVPSYSHKKTLDIVMVTCLYYRHQLWKMILIAMGTMPLKKIVAVWSEESDGEEIAKFIEEMEKFPEILQKIHFVQHDNTPVNQKWQRGIMEARAFSSQAILILESDDLVTYHYLYESMLKIEEGFDLIGSRNWLSIFLQDENSWADGVPDYIKLCQYNEERLDNEFIGSGRIISTRFLEKMKWQLYSSQNPLNNNLDKHSFLKMKPFHPKTFQIPINPNLKTVIITLRERSGENLSMSYGKHYHAQIPGNTWVGPFLQKHKQIDYLISQDLYEISLKMVYDNFGGLFQTLRGQI